MSSTPSAIVQQSQQTQSATINMLNNVCCFRFNFLFHCIQNLSLHTLSPAHREMSEIGRNASKTAVESDDDRHAITSAV